MLSSTDHLFCSRVRHLLIFFSDRASPRDLHRHSCRHFHFHFWLSLRVTGREGGGGRGYLHFVPHGGYHIFKSLIVSRAPLCVSAFLSFLLFSFFPFFLSSRSVSFFFSCSLPFAAFSFLAHTGERRICALTSDTQSPGVILALRFFASSSSLPPSSGEASP